MINIALERGEFVKETDSSTIFLNKRIKLPLIGKSSFLNNYYNKFYLNLKDNFLYINHKNIKDLNNLLNDSYEVIWLDLISPSLMKEAISAIKKINKDCFIISGIAFNKKDIDYLKESDGIVVGFDKKLKDLGFCKDLDYKEIIKLVNYIDSLNKISILKIDIENVSDYIKGIVLGADLIIKDNKFPIEDLYIQFNNIMRILGAKDLNSLKYIKYK